MEKPSSPWKKRPLQQKDRPSDPTNRRQQDRRKVECEGYIYIPMVGWFCRRDRNRRGDDSLT